MINAKTRSGNGGLTFVYLGYVDDSGTTNDKDRYGVYAAVLLPADSVPLIETIAGVSVFATVPDKLHPDFEEFHAAHLFNGWGVFEGVSEEDRFKTIRMILTALMNIGNVGVVYGAVKKDDLARGPYASASSVDIAFRECLDGIESLLKDREEQEQKRGGDALGVRGNNYCLLIVDEVSSADSNKQPIKDQIKKTFLAKRPRMWKRINRDTDGDGKILRINAGELDHIHDDLYFGDSRYSVGIQMADLCAYFIALHMAGITKGDRFYDIFKDRIAVARVKP